MPSPLEYQTEYDIQQEIEIQISYVRSELTVQGVASHAGATEVSKIESKLDSFGVPATSTGLSTTESTVESKLDDMGADYSHAGSAALGTVDEEVSAIESKLDLQGTASHGSSGAQSGILSAIASLTPATSEAVSSVDEAVSSVESKLDVMGVASLAGATPLSTVDSKVVIVDSVVDAIYAGMFAFKTHHYLTKADTDVAISAGASWTTLFGLAAPSHTLIKALKITNTGEGGTCVYRITDGTNKLFPYDVSLEYDTAEEMRLAEPLVIKKDDSYCLEVAWSTADGSAAMTEMDVIELD